MKFELENNLIFQDPTLYRLNRHLMTLRYERYSEKQKV